MVAIAVTPDNWYINVACSNGQRNHLFTAHHVQQTLCKMVISDTIDIS